MRLERYSKQSDFSRALKPGDAEFTIVRNGGKMNGHKAYSNVNAMIRMTPRHKNKKHRG